MSNEVIVDSSDLVVIPRFKVGPNGTLPQYQTSKAGCFDIVAAHSAFLAPGERAIIGTELSLDLENVQHFALSSQMVVPLLELGDRSGNAAKHGIHVLAGKIDADYPGEIKVVLLNTSIYEFPIIKGDRIAQGYWVMTLRAPGVEVLGVTRTGGFGSTGK